MKHPFTDKPLELKRDRKKATFRKHEFEAWQDYWVDPDTGEVFQEEDQLDRWLSEIHNQYREMYNLPFPEELKEIRERCGLNPRQMSLICSFGENTWRNYEAGEVPSESNGRLILLNVINPKEFIRLVNSQPQSVLSELEKQNLISRLSSLPVPYIGENDWLSLAEIRLSERRPTQYTGFAKPNLRKFFGILYRLLSSGDIRFPFRTVMCKLPFYVDFLHYALYGQSITGLRYAKLPHGPEPDQYHMLFGMAEQQRVLKCREEPFSTSTGEDRVAFIYEACNDGAIFEDELTEKEKMTIQAVLTKYGHLKSTDIEMVSHKEKVWNDTSEGAILSYVNGINPETLIEFTSLISGITPLS